MMMTATKMMMKIMKKMMYSQMPRFKKQKERMVKTEKLCAQL
jgi:hypothetical protein